MESNKNQKNGFGDLDWNEIFSVAKQFNIFDQNIIIEKIRQVLNKEYEDFKKNLISNYHLIEIDFYEKNYLERIEEEFFYIQNFLKTQSKIGKNLETEKKNNYKSFDEYIQEIRLNKRKKKTICLHCCLLQNNIKHHNFYINKEKKRFGCRKTTSILLDSDKNEILNFLTDLIQYNEPTLYYNFTNSEIQQRLKKYINERKININLNNENDVVELYENIKNLFFFSKRKKKVYDLNDDYSKSKDNNNNIELNENDNNEQKKTKIKSLKRSLKYLNINNNESHKRLRHNKIEKTFQIKKHLKRKKSIDNYNLNKSKIELTPSTQNSININSINDINYNITNDLHNKIMVIFNKHLLNNNN